MEETLLEKAIVFHVFVLKIASQVHKRHHETCTSE
jgi:hypothetical protein